MRPVQPKPPAGRNPGRVRWTLRSVVCTLAAALLSCLWPGLAQASPWTQNNIPVVQDGPGIKVGEHSRFHPGFAATIGGDSNVFWERKNAGESVKGASYLTPSAWLGIGNRRLRDGLLDSPATPTERKVDYNFRVMAAYRQYLSGDPEVRQAGKFNLLTQGRVIIMPGRKFSVAISEDFARLGEPRIFEAAREFNFNRIDHSGRIKFTLRPGGGRFEISASYLSELLYFEAADIHTGDRLVNGAEAELKWRVRDQSALVARYQFMSTYYFCCTSTQAPDGTARNEDSDAHRALAGFVGQVGKKWELEALAGYGGAFYRDDITDPAPNFSSFIGTLGAGYFPTLRSRIQARFERVFFDSLFGNYFTNLGGTLFASHEFRWRMVMQAGFGAYLRQYEGLPQPGVESTNIVAYTGTSGPPQAQRRSDTLISGTFQIEQALGRFFVIAARYAAAAQITDFTVEYTNGVVDELAFNKHLVMLFGAVRY